MNWRNFVRRTATASILVGTMLCIYLLQPLFISFLLVGALLYIAYSEWPQLMPWSAKSCILFTFNCIIPLLLLAWWNWHPSTRLLPLLVISCATLFDSGAYLAGSLFGRHKIAPRISPGKTFEGTLGGIVITHIGLSFLKTYTPILATSAPTFYVVTYGNLMCLATFCGDLWISFLKRKACIKDTGSVLPGHGGLLDRFDGITFATLMTFVLMMSTSWLELLQ